MQNILKPILVILGLVALGAVVYVFVIQKPEQSAITRTSAAGVTTPANEERQVVSNTVNVEEFQRLLLQLNTINLDSGIFTSQQYAGLIDHTQTALIKLDETKAIAPISKLNPFQSLDVVPVVTLQATPTLRITPRPR